MERGGYSARVFVKAWENGRKDGRAGLRYDEMRDWAERPCCRRAYSKGFALGKTEEVLGRAVIADIGTAGDAVQ
jgi:hypothetical protein